MTAGAESESDTATESGPLDAFTAMFAQVAEGPERYCVLNETVRSTAG
ncbi:MAG: hypothetical protein OXH79_09190 [Boseongicola sp.]|nr:hypothetical protein [Boseongicola sp.]